MSPAEKAKVNAILRKESRNMRLSIECKTIFVSVWDAVMKLTAVGKYYFSSDIRNFKNINPPPTPYNFLGRVHVFAGRVKIVSHSSRRASLILKYFCPLNIINTSFRFLKRLASRERNLLTPCPDVCLADLDE